MVDKRPIGYIPGKGNPLDKKAPKSKKYDYVSGTLSTGPTIKDINIMSDQAIAKRRNELFKRIKTSTLDSLLKQERNFESIYNLGEENKEQLGGIRDNMSVVSQQSVPLSVQSQGTHISAITYATERLGITDDTCFLLLDIREPEDYELFHIRESISFPAPNISRDKFIPQIYRFKNQPDKLIIIYHSDERNGTPIAQKLSEKGFENVFLLSGGIEKFMNEYPEELEGKKVPVIKKVIQEDEDNKSRSSVQKSQISVQSNTKSITSNAKSSITNNNKQPIKATNNNNNNNSSIMSKNTVGTTQLNHKPIIVGVVKQTNNYNSNNNNNNTVQNQQTQKRSSSSSVQQKSLINQSQRGSNVNKNINESYISNSNSNNTPSKLVKRSNYREYPQTGDVLMQRDLQGEREIQNIMFNSALKNQSNRQMSPSLINDSIFSSNNNNHLSQFKKQ